MFEPTRRAVLAWLAMVVVGVLALRGRVFAHALQLVAAHSDWWCSDNWWCFNRRGSGHGARRGDGMGRRGALHAPVVDVAPEKYISEGGR